MNPSVVPPSPAPGPWFRLLLGAAACLAGAAALAEVELTFAVDAIVGEDWQVQGVTVGLVEFGPERFSAELALQRLQLSSDQGEITGLRLACPEVEHGDAGWRCATGSLSIEASPVGAQQGSWEGSVGPAGEARLEIPRLEIASGTVALSLSSTDGRWSLRARPYRASVSELAALSDAVDLPRGWGVRGRVSGLVTVDGALDGVSRAAAELVVDQLAYASPDGTQAAEKVVIKADVDARLRGAAWQFDTKVEWPQGAVYADPLYLDAAQGVMTARAAGSWQPASSRLVLDAWSLDLAGTANVTGTGRFSGTGFAVEDLTIAARVDDAGSFYQRLLQPFLIGTAADDLSVAGRVGVVLHFDRQGVEQAGLELNRLALEDRQGRFALERCDGSVGWDRSREVPVSRLTVAGASVYRIPAGAFSVSMRFAGERVELVEAVVVPVLGGSVALDRFALSGALMAGETPRWEASASVRGVSLEQLTRTLEWPPFNGTVSGQLRDMRYADQVFRVGGGLQLSAFDGDIRVDDLSIRDPFGTVPILTASATMRRLKLEALTETFSFGRIEGRLDADMKDIQLVGWQPDRFDLHLYTPEDDDSRHRISQRAVENLTELGSGVPAGLSATFLRVFDEFRYDRIDLKVGLRGSVAELDGLARPDGGYYLVRGSGLPRIDVIGRNRSVAWKDLVKRLQQIQVEGAQIR